MHLDEAGNADVRRRLRRAEGQLRGVIAMLDDGRDCTEVLTQLAAVTRALHRAGYAMLADGLEQCLSAPADGERKETVARLEKLFLSLG
ncbi:metal-sensitive transcriptional regulator [Plantactinospora sp. WMMB334]|uniref:metal-sensitive transcriptional regulator n=1 Tax=Plantactinospora sp. WMMB334 TaxID=3404119 RepID=UPI003B96127D